MHCGIEPENDTGHQRFYYRFSSACQSGFQHAGKDN